MTPRSAPKSGEGSASREVRQQVQSGEWLLLIHQLPPRPAYLRVKVRRRLHRLGALALKNTVYGLPASDSHLEDFQWLAREIIADGGDALICTSRFIATDVMDGAARRTVGRSTRRSTSPAARRAGTPPGAVWVTRKDVFVDRMASAWLIRRFIDRSARFRFVSAGRYKPRAGDVRFDMYGGEYTHVGDRCTFETLLQSFHLADRRLALIGQIVHDLDLKDDRYRRPEGPGVAAQLDSIRKGAASDARRIARAALVFDELYDRLAGRSGQR